MVAERQPHPKAGRPSAVGVTRSKQIPPTPVTPDEEEFIRKAIEFIGEPITHWCREQLIAAARRVHEALESGIEPPAYQPPVITSYPIGTIVQRPSSPYAEIKTKDGWKRHSRYVKEQQLGRPLSRHEIVHHDDENPENDDESNLVVMNQSEHARLHNSRRSGKSTVLNNAISQYEIADLESQIPEGNQLYCEIPQTRARAPKDLRKEDLRDQDRSSLRSDQAAPASETDDAPWQKPVPLKHTIQLSTGQMATNIWVFANGLLMEPIDMSRIMNTSSLKNFRKALLQCWARSLRDVYRLRWCAAYKRRSNAWHDTGRSNAAFMKAAEYLIAEFIGRGMTTSQFIDAANELRPKSIRFVTADLLGGSIGARVAAWVPPEQRDRDKGLSTHVDSKGQTWVTPDSEAPVPVLRSKADREQFLRQHGIKS